jgi:hypothetical protein
MMRLHAWQAVASCKDGAQTSRSAMGSAYVTGMRGAPDLRIISRDKVALEPERHLFRCFSNGLTPQINPMEEPFDKNQPQFVKHI